MANEIRLRSNNIRTVVMEDTGTSLFTYTANLISSTTITATLVNTSITNLVPMTWTTGDRFTVRGSYEAAT